MRILFYRIAQKGEVISLGVHIAEVLYGLSKLGHTIVYAGGQRYSTFENDRSERPERHQHQSLWRRIKAFVLTLPFRDEISLLWGLFNETKLFCSALITTLKNRPDIVYRRHELFASEYVLAKLMRLPSVKEVNGIIFDEAKTSKSKDRLSLRIIGRTEKFSLSKADRHIAVTSVLKTVLHSDYKIPEDKIVVIQNGANTDLFCPVDKSEARKILNLSEEYNYVCFVGSLFYWQGLHNLLKSVHFVLEKYPDTRFLIIGDGPMKAELIEQARQAGISDNVVFTGAVSYEKVPLYINAGDVCVVPKVPLKSGYSPLKLYEYMACGRPVIATRTEGFEILEENDAGLLVNPENSQQFANAIMQLLADKELGSRMGENGRTYVVENHSWEIVARRVADICQQTIQKYTKQHEGK